jgi:hypothetical protein
VALGSCYFSPSTGKYLMRLDKFDEATAMFEMSVTFALQRFGRGAWLTMNVPPTSRKGREIWATLCCFHLSSREAVVGDGLEV